MTPNFSKAELGCRCCGGVRLPPGFAQALQGVRDAMQEPLLLSSACRCARHNQSIGGHPRSLHVFDQPHWPTGGCCAVDVVADMSREMFREKLLAVAWARGWSVGIHPKFIHLDLRSEYAGLPQTKFYY